MSMSFKASPDGTYGEILINGTSEAKVVSGATATDTTADRLLKVGDFGVGNTTGLGVIDANTQIPLGVYFIGGASPNLPVIADGCLEVSGNYSRPAQVFTTFSTNRKFSRTLATSSNFSTWTPWREIYHQGSILGTVSQSSGVPTGAIIERGSNANGEYVRFADGTQICWHNNFAIPAINTAVGSLFRCADTAWTYPAAFSTIPVGSGKERGGAAFTWLALGSSADENAVEMRFSVFRYAAVGAAVYKLLAIGRWH